MSRSSGGQRGASVETLRGKHGADFEGTATVKRGNERPLCHCFEKSVRLLFIPFQSTNDDTHEPNLFPRYKFIGKGSLGIS